MDFGKLPKEWRVSPLEDICVIIAGQSPASEFYNSNADGFPFFQGKTDFGDLYPQTRIYCSKPKKTADYNDILLSVRAPVGPTNLSPGKVCIGRGITAIRVTQQINYKYILYYFRSIEKHLTEMGTGTTFKAITQDEIKRIRVPLPSIPEQERIVVKIDELFSELDKGIETLQKVKEQLRVYRQAVLKDAFNSNDKFELLGNLCDTRLGKMLDKHKNKGVHQPYIRNLNVRWFEFDLSDLLEMRFEPDEEDRFNIIAGDLVICEGGEPGRCAIWKESYPIKYQKALHRIRPAKTVKSEYIMYYLWYIGQSGIIQKYFTGTGIKHLTGESLKKIPIPVNTIVKQTKIVEIIESQFSVCDKIEQTINEALQQSDSLRQSVLNKAFKGQLI